MNSKTTLQELQSNLSPFEKSSNGRSLWQMANSVVPFLALWCAAYLALSVSFWITLALSVLACGFFIRTFIIFHDCCHQSFFKSRRANEWTGIITGILTFFPYYQWRYEHAVHHASSGNLDRRGTGDIWSLTVKEYLALPLSRKIWYRVYRNPFFMFGVGPIHLSLIGYRLNRKGAGRRERLNTHMTNLALVGIFGLLCWTLGWQKVLLVEGPILYLAGIAGIWLFYVQHQFEGTYFVRTDDWGFETAALQGSSFYKLPKILQWMTGNIGFHHVHHLGTRVPNYNLQRVHESTPSLQLVPTVSLLSSLRALRYRLWSEERGRFVRFKDIR